MLCRYPDLVTPDGTNDVGYAVSSTGPAQVFTDNQYIVTGIYAPEDQPSGDFAGILVRFDNATGSKGGKIKVWVSCHPD